MARQPQKEEELVLLRWRDVFVFSLAAIVLLVVANIAWVFPILEEVETNAYSLLREKGGRTADRVETFLKHDLEALENGAVLVNRELEDPEDVVIRLLRENKAFDALILLDRDGDEFLIKQNRFTVETGILSTGIFETVRENQIYRSELLFNKLKQPTIEYAIPLQETTGLSAIVAQINLKIFLDQIFENLETGENSAVYIADRHGNLIGHTTWALVAEGTNVSDRQLVAGALEGRAVDTREEKLIYTNENGNRVFASALPLEPVGWALVAEETQNPALAAARRTLTVAIISFGFQILLIILLLFIYYRLIRAARLFYTERNQREAIMNNLVDGIIEYDELSQVILMNPRAESLLGVKRSEISDLPITPSVLKGKPHLAALVEVMYPALAPYASAPQKLFGGRAKLMEIHTSKPERVFEMTMLHILDQRGKVIGFLKIIHDVSRERFFEKIKSEFVSIAAHQLRTPLSQIKWSLIRILNGDEGDVNEQQKELLKKIYGSGERMIQLVKDLLDVARIEEGRYLHKPSATDIGAVIQSILKSVEESTERKNIAVKFRKERGLPALFLDRENISSAIQNIIENAVNYTLPGGEITVSAKRINSYIEIVIEDTGIGIPKEDRQRIFTKFFRAKNALRLETEGSGLGLFISKNIIEAHEGKIWFESAENKGSAFHIALPIRKDQ